MILGFAFIVGLMHALDADHIMAVSGLASARAGSRSSIRFCTRWAMGHGVTLLLIGIVVLLLGAAIPVALSRIAESSVGAVLILIGLWMLWDLRRRNAHLHFHQHDGLPPHAHWHVHESEQCHHHNRDSHTHQHGAVIVGVIHGLAGSAPLLALLPLASAGSPWLGIAYVLVFGLGVLMMMVLFGGLLGWVIDRLDQWSALVLTRLRTMAAIISMGMGGYWLYAAF
jgi:ABC-type nickel/cobalt efflux system permease component RcnA